MNMLMLVELSTVNQLCVVLHSSVVNSAWGSERGMKTSGGEVLNARHLGQGPVLLHLLDTRNKSANSSSCWLQVRTLMGHNLPVHGRDCKDVTQTT